MALFAIFALCFSTCLWILGGDFQATAAHATTGDQLDMRSRQLWSRHLTSSVAAIFGSEVFGSSRVA